MCIEQSDQALLERAEIGEGARTCDAPALLEWEKRTAQLCGWIEEVDRGP